jgi:drug/metabolite transporter (DMT)-like permease
MTAGVENSSKQMRSPRASSARALIASPYALLAFASLCWSGNHVVGRAIAGHVPPIGISMLRWLLPSIVLWFVARRHYRKDWPLIRQHWRIMLCLGLTGGALFSALQYVGLQYTGALNVSVLNSLTPVLIVAAGALIFRDRIAFVQVAGIALSLIGVLVIVARADLETLLRLQFNWGDLIILFNMALLAVYAAYLRLRPSIHWLSFLFLLGVISTAATLPFAIWEGVYGMRFQPTLLTAATILYVSIFPSVLAFAAWNQGIDVIGANRAGPFLHLIPVFTALIATTLLGETLARFHIIGFVMILTGVWLASRNPDGQS